MKRLSNTDQNNNKVDNARVTPRLNSTASGGATPTLNTDLYEMFIFTAQAAAITSMTTNLSGTPANGQKLWISITDNGTARAITWGASFEDGSVILPSTTVVSTRLDIGLVWNATTSKWRCMAISSPEVPAGAIVQVVSTNFTGMATGTTTIPFDDTIPQNTEGTEFMTQAITPKSTTNILVITTNCFVGVNVTNNNPIMCLFQDSTANALAATTMAQATAIRSMLTLTHTMAAGTTSATTFKVRIGNDSAATVTFNGNLGGRIFGAITKANITIYEMKA